jgi:hypothetical protein
MKLTPLHDLKPRCPNLRLTASAASWLTLDSMWTRPALLRADLALRDVGTLASPFTSTGPRDT